MPNRIDSCFARLRSGREKGFIPYICAGDPSFARTIDLVQALEDAGADLIELGVPFSDPLADGIVNQLASQRALNAGATVRGVLACVEKIRKKSGIPIVLYTYLNPIIQFGLDQFHRQAEAAGVDGLLILDLPPDEDLKESENDRLERSSSEPPKSGKKGDEGVIHIRLIAPTTPPDRIALIARGARGFLYYVSREGVTGARDRIAVSLAEKIGAIRKQTDLPVAVGFGISNPKQAGEVALHADAVVVGSAIVDLIAKHGANSGLLERVGAFARTLAEAIRSA